MAQKFQSQCHQNSKIALDTLTFQSATETAKTRRAQNAKNLQEVVEKQKTAESNRETAETD